MLCQPRSKITIGAAVISPAASGPRLSCQRARRVRTYSAPKQLRIALGLPHSGLWALVLVLVPVLVLGSRSSGGCLLQPPVLPWPCPVLPFPSFIFNRAAAHLRHTDRTQNHPHWLLPVPFSQVRSTLDVPPAFQPAIAALQARPTCLPACLPRLVFARSYLACLQEPDKARHKSHFCRHRQLPLT